MDGHFRDFSFVDRITGLTPGVAIRGQYVIPARLSAFPASLVAEAVGQLAAWAAMAAVGFTHRPVAGIANRIDLLSPVRPGQTLELAADLHSVDTETVGYAGTAHVDNTPVVRLEDCVGPMLPAEEFDDPRSLQERFELISGDGAPPGAMTVPPVFDLENQPGGDSLSARALLRVPARAPFFEDHFPRRPVFPGTLLVQASLETAARLAAEAAVSHGTPWTPRVISDVKLRTFIAPGETLSLEARRTGADASVLHVTVESRSNQRLVGSARIAFTP